MLLVHPVQHRRRDAANRRISALHSIDMHGAGIVGGSFRPRWPLDYEFGTHTIAQAKRGIDPTWGFPFRVVPSGSVLPLSSPM
jgi:hypothetical protein